MNRSTGKKCRRKNGRVEELADERTKDGVENNRSLSSRKEGKKETGTGIKTLREKDPFSLQSEIFVDFVRGMFSSLSNFP